MKLRPEAVKWSKKLKKTKQKKNLEQNSHVQALKIGKTKKLG